MTSRGRRLAMVALLVLAALYAVKDSIGGQIHEISAPYDPYIRLFAVSRLILVAIAALIVRKPTLSKSDVLLFWGILGLSLDVFWQYTPVGPSFWFSAILGNCAIGFGMAQLVRYAAEDHPSQRFRRTVAMWAAAIGATIAVAGFAPIALYYGNLGGRTLDETTFAMVAPWLDRIRWLGMLAGALAIESCAAAALRTATTERKAHALLVVASFAPLAVATSTHAAVRIITAHDVDAVRNIDVVGNVATAAGLAYGTLTQRLVNVEFYVSAALAAALAGAALTVLAFLGEHFFVPWISDLVERLPVLVRFGPAVRIGAQLLTAFAAFLALTKVYDEAGPLLRNAIFHHREQHLAALRAFGEAVTSLDTARIAPALVDAATQHAAASFGAVYRRAGDVFVLVYGAGEPQPPPRITASDARLPTSLSAHVNDDGSAAFAMPAGERIAGFLLVGPKRDAVAFAPDELRALGLATREAGIAMAGIGPATDKKGG
ncbi:MAG: hypothetical protein ACLQHL_05855 [Candidatus Cybelea sp.]